MKSWSFAVPSINIRCLGFLLLLAACGESRGVSDYERMQAEAARDAAQQPVDTQSED